MYAGVPKASFTPSGAIRPEGVIPSLPNASLTLAVRARCAMPKSMIFTTPAVVRSTLPGLMSRCTTPRS